MGILFFSFPDHERRVGELANELGFSQVSLSHQVMPMIRIVPRGFTACADAYLTPHIKTYLKVIQFIIWFTLFYFLSFKYFINSMVFFFFF